MLVDDEVDILWLFKMILESDAGLKVDAFSDPIVALENFRPGLYDLLLIDIAMPLSQREDKILNLYAVCEVNSFLCCRITADSQLK